MCRYTKPMEASRATWSQHSVGSSSSVWFHFYAGCALQAVGFILFCFLLCRDQFSVFLVNSFLLQKWKKKKWKITCVWSLNSHSGFVLGSVDPSDSLPENPSYYRCHHPWPCGWKSHWWSSTDPAGMGQLQLPCSGEVLPAGPYSVCSS